MFPGKNLFSTPWIIYDRRKHLKPKQIHYIFVFKSYFSYILLLLISLSTWFLLLSCFSFSSTTTKQQPTTATCRRNISVYVYDLPAEFNRGLLRNCRHLNIYTDMCPHVANHGLGQPLSAAATATAWYSTHQFLAELIFHARLENYPCRTLDPSRADIFYVPFYGGLYASSVFRQANHTARDELGVRLADFLQMQPTWHNNQGKDHFIAIGRTAWDFMRIEDGQDFGANRLLNLRPVQNMSVLTVERQPWQGRNQYGIPYPSYFHPSNVVQMRTWQQKITSSTRRPYLFSFVGGPRKGVEKAAIRGELIRQCKESSRCKLLQCGVDGSNNSKCFDPREVIKVMRQSQFCLQPPGDSFTRRSTFDAVLAGCIPVFFAPHTAYTQYKWYFSEDVEEYSVYIDGDEIEKRNRRVEELLLKISRVEVERMRRKIIEMMPRVTYANPNSTDVGFEDAVDVALVALAKNVRSKLGLM